MKTHSRLCRVTLLFFSHSILLLTPTAMVEAQTPMSITGCDATVKAKLYFKRLRTQFIKDSSSVDKSEFRRAASNYIRLAEQCYESTVGAPASGQRIDEGGMWMGPSGATTTAPPVSEDFVLFGRKWGAGSPFAGGTDVPGPRLPGGTVSYSFMVDGVDLTIEAPGLFNVAISSMASFAPCFLDEIELAFGAWSAVADILFVPVTDGGGPFNVEPMAGIRIGAHVFDGPSGTLAHAFFPPPNGVTAAGDTHFDSAESWSCAPGAGSFGFGIVAVHEVGHAIGLSHEFTEIAVMNPFYNAALTFGPLADDLIGAGEIYGEAFAAVTSFFGPVGIGTASPGADLHVKGANTPTLRLEQSGLTPQTWDVSGNETNFFVGDVTNSKLPFRIRPGAPNSSIDIAASGNVGLGTDSPSAPLHVQRADSSTVLIKAETNGPQAKHLLQNGSSTWDFSGGHPNFVISNVGSGVVELRLTRTSGNLTIAGGLVTTGGGGACTGGDPCDGVFQPDFEVESIEEHAAFMWRNSHLKGVGSTNENGPINITQKVGGLINELEKAHIYIERLHERLGDEESRNDALENRLARLEAMLTPQTADD